MKLIVLWGRPAVGKLTVGRELVSLTGWRLFHNHLIVDALLAVFEFGSTSFIELRERMWLDVFREAHASGVPALIFTFSPENTVRQEFISQFCGEARARGDELHFVELTCADEAAERRLANTSRLCTRKLTSLALYRKLLAEGTFNLPIMPAAELRLSTDDLPPAEVARIIHQHLVRAAG